ncbi:hypothetical protein C1I99_00400 [Micromonospora deserti]|uniref:Uncharacterized protein n=1 Tax=Micromonospora deserti TaxID=2070366 RepID=A0A2W2CTV7_9ACTN|nr:hypothetical protein C1I99_00400 [Micromonospora deserti]
MSGAVPFRTPWNCAYATSSTPSASGATGPAATVGAAPAGAQGHGTSAKAALTSSSSSSRRNGSTVSSATCRVSTVRVIPTPVGSSTTCVSRCQAAWLSPAVQEKVLRAVAARSSPRVVSGTGSTPPTGSRTSLK